ncbi:MAG: oxidoreductase [Pseudomonadota bacterium]
MTDATTSQAAEILGAPLDLPGGLRLKNRLIKSPMSDGLGDGAGNPTLDQSRLYARWAEGGAALSLIGEVQISPEFPESPGNLVLAPGSADGPWRDLAQRGAGHGAQLWPQLGHAGALAHAALSRPRGPSPLSLGGRPVAGMGADDIAALPSAYGAAALRAKRLGFRGVQIHAGHGFLLSQFLSPFFNHRSDGYGGSRAGRFRLIGEVIAATRQAVGPGFAIGIRINATDQLEGGLTEADARETLRLLSGTSIDLIDISGGSYVPGAPASSDGTAQDGAYFAEVAKAARALTRIPVVLTGGIKRRAQAVDLLRNGGADAIGLARAMVLDPALPKSWLAPKGTDPVFPRFDAPPPGGITAWYTMRLAALAAGGDAAPDLDLSAALGAIAARDAQRIPRWQARFGAMV